MSASMISSCNHRIESEHKYARRCATFVDLIFVHLYTWRHILWLCSKRQIDTDRDLHREFIKILLTRIQCNMVGHNIFSMYDRNMDSRRSTNTQIALPFVASVVAVNLYYHTLRILI